MYGADEDCLVDALREYRGRVEEHGGAHVELEIRLGVLNESFRSGVTKDIFYQLEHDMGDSLHAADATWIELVDYHYMDSEGRSVRTRVTYDSDNMAVDTEHICKTSLSSHNVYRMENGDSARVALSIENSIANPPKSCLPHHVRIKQRRRFQDVRDGRVVWVYELSRTWSANSRSAVEYRQHHMEPCYEVECELVDEGGVYMSCMTDEKATESVLMKIRALLGENENVPMVVKRVKSGRRKKKT